MARATLALLLLAHSSALLLAPLRCVSPPTHAPRMAIPDEVAEVAPLRCVSPPTRAALRMAIPDEVANNNKKQTHRWHVPACLSAHP